ncbi:hypothetical protein [Klebsiella pneumoniae]|uniref:hypothetical protein n=1 Tax=Klebsiella pneumoniae TaxID=573 RepID=UPI001BAF2360|nr:hypothetical protein [Klebsiella pneumoniae]
MSRSIPSLSGGEIQKLIFSRLLTSNTTGILIVIDEISSQINPIDFEDIFKKLKKLSEKNTVILVEHSQYFIDLADQQIHVGKYAGSSGGEICEKEKIKPQRNLNPKNNISDYYYFEGLNKNNIINQNIRIPKAVSYTHLDVYKRQVTEMGSLRSKDVDKLIAFLLNQHFIYDVNNICDIEPRFSRQITFWDDFVLERPGVDLSLIHI